MGFNHSGPCAPADAVHFIDEVDFIDCEHPPVSHDPLAINHHGFDISRLAVVDPGRDDAHGRHQVGATHVDHEQVGLLAYLHREGYTDRLYMDAHTQGGEEALAAARKGQPGEPLGWHFEVIEDEEMLAQALRK